MASVSNMSNPFPFRKIGKSGKWQCLMIEDISDGEQRHWPAKPYRVSSEEGHYVELGDKWAEQLRIKEPGFNYYVDRLPHGYAAFEIDKAGSGGSVTYKRLFGHPSGRYYDSAVRFSVHFLWLMSGMQGDCDCVLCSKKKAAHLPLAYRKHTLQPSPAPQPKPMMVRPARTLARDDSPGSTRDSSTGIATNRARREAKQSTGFYAVDEEGTEDVYKKFLQRLDTHRESVRGIDMDIEEENSLDWRAEHEYNGLGQDILPASITQVEQQHSFIPRVGEVVLWCPDFLDGHYLLLNETSQYMFYSFEQKAWSDFPVWRAGVVTAVPSKTTQNGTIDVTDILDAPRKTTALNTAGFRVETLPDPNDDLNKGASKQYKYVPLRNIRPLSHWRCLLWKVPEKSIHPSIKYALTTTTSISLLEKFKAVGQSNWGKIMCKGIYLGAELLTVGDVIRLVPLKQNTCTDVMVIESIRLNLDDIRPDHVLSSSPYLSSRSSITFTGPAYTLAVPADDEVDDEIHIAPSTVPLKYIKTHFRPVGSAEYGDWFYLHDSRKRFEVSHDQVLGRMYEADAVRLWTGQLQYKLKGGNLPTHKPSLSFDVAGILAARKYATQTDARLLEPSAGNETMWFWADTRAEALGIETFNGVEVGKYDGARTESTLKHWTAHLAVLNGRSLTAETSKYINFAALGDLLGGTSGGAARGRKPGSRVVNGKVLYPGDKDYPVGGASGYGRGGDDDGDDFKATPTRNTTMSAMQGAAFASTDEDASDSAGEGLELIDVAQGQHGEEMLRQFVRKDSSPSAKKPMAASTVPSKPARKLALSKTDIMESIEGAGEFDDDVPSEDSDEEDWFNEPLPPARGGTEESEGGDYDPERSQRQ